MDNVIVLAKAGGFKGGGFRATPKFSAPKISKPATIKPLPKNSVGKPIVKNDTKVAVPKAEKPKTTTTGEQNSFFKSGFSSTPRTVYVGGNNGFSFSDYLFYRWLFDDHHSTRTEQKTEQGGSFSEEKGNSNFMNFSLFLMVLLIIVAVVVWWNKRNE